MVSAIYVSGANSLGSGPLMLAGTKEQLEKYLGPVARGEKYPSFGLTEPGAGSDAGSVVTNRRQGRGLLGSQRQKGLYHSRSHIGFLHNIR
jgi:alkylation response protein AidB-like acyl-CoA dehydrogenase